jgi:hypothetical protein
MLTRIRMEWQWVEGYPMFVYTKWIDTDLYKVKVVKGVKGDQNAGDTGPEARAFMTFTLHGMKSRELANVEAFDRVEKMMKGEKA